jgi:hypothetical protein
VFSFFKIAVRDFCCYRLIKILQKTNKSSPSDEKRKVLILELTFKINIPFRNPHPVEERWALRRTADWNQCPLHLLLLNWRSPTNTEDFYDIKGMPCGSQKFSSLSLKVLPPFPFPIYLY